MKANKFFLICLFVCYFGHAQVRPLLLHDSLTTTFPCFAMAVDESDNVYTLESDGLLHLYKNRESITNAQNKWSKSSVISASNPYKITVFDTETQQLAIYDNKLSLLSLIDLSEMNADAVVLSKNNFYWLYCQADNTIYQISENHSILGKTKINEKSETGLPQLIEKNENLFLFLPGKAVLIFDLWGNLLREIPSNSQLFSVNSNGIWLIENQNSLSWVSLIPPYLSQDYYLEAPWAIFATDKQIITQSEKKIKFFYFK